MKAIRIIYFIVAILVILAGAFCLVQSIRGQGNGYLPLALGLICIGNVLTYFGNKKLRNK